MAGIEVALGTVEEQPAPEASGRTSGYVEKLDKAFKAAKAFIECHAADHDLTPEMVEKYAEYKEATKDLDV